MSDRLGLAVGRAIVSPLVGASFLTVLPMPVPRTLANGPMGWPVASFPLAGAAIGALIGAEGLLLTAWFPPAVVAGLMITTLLAVTGALHLDALMDSFDGLFGGKDPDGRLAIMRDSRVGSYGIAAAGSLLLLEYGALLSLSPVGRLQALVVAGALSRGAMAITMASFPAASSRGLAAGLKPHLRSYHTVAAALLAVVVAGGLLRWAGLAMAAMAGALVLLGGRLAMAKIGGISGDICGGLGELVETVTLLACVVAFS